MKRLLGALMLAAAAPATAADYAATVHFARRVELGLAVSGVVERVEARPGHRVPKDQLLVALETTPFQAAVEQAEAEVARAAAAHTEAARDYRQARELYDRTMLSAVELENAKLAEHRASADLKRARARLRQARYELAHSALRAPFDAWVLEVRAQPGQSVVNTLAAAPLVVLAAYGEFEARTRVPPDVLEGLRVGQAATVGVGGRRYPGSVQGVGLEPVDGNTYEVRVVFTAEERLLAGTSARVEFR